MKLFIRTCSRPRGRHPLTHGFRRCAPLSSILRSLALLLAPLLLPASSPAAPLTEKQVRAAVETWVRQVTAEARPDAVIQSMEAYAIDGRTVGYVAQLDGRGFCLCGADDLLLPVYFYSPDGRYDPFNPGLMIILAEMGTRFGQAFGQRSAASSEMQTTLAARASDWQDLITGRRPATLQRVSKSSGSGPTMMTLPLTSRWAQGHPYNDSCPTVVSYPSPERTLVGCVALAMAQIMNYWKWPAHGQGSSNVVVQYNSRTDWDSWPLSIAYVPPSVNQWNPNKLQWTNTAGGQLRMAGYWNDNLRRAATNLTGSTATYRAVVETLYSRLPLHTDTYVCDLSVPIQWGLFQDEHADPADPGDAAVADFLWRAGGAAWMGYAPTMTGGSIANVPAALRNSFFYDPAVTGVAPANVDINEMTTEIQWLRPIQMDGWKGRDGHDWVAFGYNMGTDPNRQFKLNLGWGGTSDGWYSWDALPYPTSWNYLKYIAPNAVKFVGATSAGTGGPASPYMNLAQAVLMAPDNATLIFKADSVNTVPSGGMKISRPLKLKGWNVAIRRQ